MVVGEIFVTAEELLAEISEKKIKVHSATLVEKCELISFECEKVEQKGREF